MLANIYKAYDYSWVTAAKTEHLGLGYFMKKNFVATSVLISLEYLLLNSTEGNK